MSLSCVSSHGWVGAKLQFFQFFVVFFVRREYFVGVTMSMFKISVKRMTMSY